jgi:hypothetical protein
VHSQKLLLIYPEEMLQMYKSKQHFTEKALANNR